MLKSAYETNQEYLEPDVIGEIPIPVPKSKALVNSICQQVIKSINELEKSINNNTESLDNLLMALNLKKEVNKRDAVTA